MNKPMTAGERWTYVATVVVILGLFALEIASDFAPAKLSALFLLLAWVPLLAIHEGGHALAARVLGGHVDQVVIGFGRTLWFGTIGGIEVEVRALPIEGFTITRGTDGRVRRALVYFAGPGAELLIALALLLAVGPERIFERSEAIAIIGAQSVCVAAVASAAINLIPAEAKDGEHGERRVANDGLGILRSLFGRR